LRAMSLITSFRMYNADPKAAAAWRALFGRVFADTGLDIAIVEHVWPQPIESLWAEPELCCAFMCGWPFARSMAATPQLQPIAAPVPSPARYESLPRYCSDFLVRAESGWRRIEDGFGARFGWMAENSHSGFNAPRAHLARLRGSMGGALFSEVRGPLGNPAKVIEALRDRDIDMVALDGYYLDLVRHHDPAKLAGLAVVGSTPWAPIPLLVAAPAVAAATVDALRAHLLTLHERDGYAPLLREVLLARFVAPEAHRYVALEEMAREAERSGYAAIR
jgi:ABC-type phosphate/phosphonate transport system substrate-binding protein